MKAIIMAGGEGTRLRPLTCDCPKPMIRLMNRPVMQYALALLRRHGVTEIAATLGYQPDAVMDAFGDGGDFGVDLRYYVEKTPLGTAGGVRQADDFLDETFIVLSGDGITDLDITAALAFHRRKGALATLVLKHADNPLDYGVVVADAEGRVRAFHEKPDWSEVMSDTVNTGIYILEPEVLARIPADRAFDFGHDLFPAMVRDGLPVYGYVMQGYWCDIGDVRAYLAAHVDALEGRIHLEGLVPRARVAQLPGAQVDRSAVLEGPCLIGPGARVCAGARVGPYSVLGPGCVVGEGASVKRAVLWRGAVLEARAQARGCVLAAGAALGEGAQAYEESTLGTGARLGARAVLLPGVKLWPGKQAADGERVEANVVWGGPGATGFAAGTLLASTPARAVRAAQAIVAVTKPGEWLLGRSPDAASNALWHAAASGAMAQGTRVLDAGVTALPLLRHAQRLTGCDGAALVTAEGILPLNALGARLVARQQRAVLAANARQDFGAPFSAGTHCAGTHCAGTHCAGTPCAETEDRSGDVRDFAARACAREIAARFTADPEDALAVALYAPGDPLRAVAAMTFARAGLRARVESDEARMSLAPGELGLFLNETGERCDIADDSGALGEAEAQLMLAWVALEAGERTLLVPPSETRAIGRLAADYGARIETLAGDSALWMNALAERFPNQFALRADGLCAAVMIIDALASAKLALSQWREAMPAVARRSRTVPIARGERGRVLHAFAARQPGAELGGGVRICRGDDWAMLCPDETRPELRIVAEAADAETARELCDFCEEELRRLLKDQGEEARKRK